MIVDDITPRHKLLKQHAADHSQYRKAQAEHSDDLAAMLSIPPLTRGDADMKKPMMPKPIADISTNRPQPGWPVKINRIPPMAAMIASVAAVPVLWSMTISFLRTNGVFC